MQKPAPVANETDLDFMLPVATAYAVICATWWACKWMAADRWKDEEEPQTKNKWIDLGMVLVAIVGVFLLGNAYRAGLRIPTLPGNWDYLGVTINLIIPFLPIFGVLAIRRQSTLTLWMSQRELLWKIGVGFAASITGLATYLSVGNQWHRLNEILIDSVTLHSLSHALPVFLEGVAIAFIFVRLRWIMPAWVAVLIPCLLFASAHIPRFLESEQNITGLIVFVTFNTFVAAVVFSTSLRARDIIWISIPHYMMDIAIQAFR